MSALPESENAFVESASLVAEILRAARHKFGLALGFLLLGSLTEGLSILMLLPILGTLAANDGSYAVQVPSWVQAWLPIPDGSIDLSVLLAGFVGLVTFQALFMRFKTIYMSQLIMSFINHLRRSMFESIGRTSWAAFAKAKGSDLNHSLNGEIDRTQVAAIYCFMFLQNLILLVAYSILSVIVSPAMTAFSALFGLLLVLLLRPIRRRAAEYGQTLTQDMKAQFHQVSEFLGGFKMAKSLNVESVFLNRFGQSLDNMNANSRRYIRISSIGTAGFQIGSALAGASFIYVALVHLSMSLPQIVVMLVLLMRLAPRFMDIQTNIQQLLINLPAYASMRRLKARFDSEREIDPPTQAPPPCLRTSIVVSDLVHQYTPGADRPAISNASFEIPAGQVTALIGPSGSGKSTIADILLGLIEPLGGRVEVDGRRIDSANRRVWRGEVAYVPQDVFLLNDTIAANLRVAAPEATDEEISRALDAAQASFVHRMPEGLNTVVGDRGMRLSGGERQRIALARALLHHPQLLILDEATSSLDWENQREIAAAIQHLKGSMTIVTIAHRPSMITFADWVIAVEDGKVVETGPFRLLTRKPNSRLARLIAGEVKKDKKPQRPRAVVPLNGHDAPQVKVA